MKRLLSGALVGAVLVLGGCGVGRQDSSSDAPAATAATGGGGGLVAGDGQSGEAAPGVPETQAGSGVEPVADDGGGADTTSAASEGQGSTPPRPDVATEPGREVILTGAVDLEVADVAPTVAKAIVLVQGLGGFLVGEQSDYASETATSVLTVRVPPDRFRAALDRLSQLGRVVSQNVGSEDVTAAVVDLQSRVQSAVISVERLRLYLADAPTMADVAVLESELNRRESDLEAMRAQLRSLEDRVAFATIVVTVRVEPVDGRAADEPAPGFSDAVDGGRRALVTAASAIALVVGAVLPWLPVALVVVLLVWATRRLVRRDRRPPPPPADPPPAIEQEERQPEPVG
jgi:hypothetical protein